MSVTWDSLYIWSHNGKAQLTGATLGCGCCAESVSEENLARAIILINEHIEEREAEIVEWREWKVRAETTGRIIEWRIY